jgi:hypothetical protein
MDKGNIAITVMTRRKGKLDLTVNQAIGTAIAIDAPVTPIINMAVRKNVLIVRSRKNKSHASDASENDLMQRYIIGKIIEKASIPAGISRNAGEEPMIFE